jgi:hypothetical protein
MSNISIEKLIETITTLFITTTEAQEAKKGKVSVEALLESFSSDDVKNQLKKLIKEGMPKQAGEKKLKDENAPKRPKSGYMFFAEKKRPEIKEAQPELKMIEISKVIGERWKSAVPATKDKYNNKSEKDKERYKQEMASYKRPSDEVLLTQKINQKKKRGKQASGDKKKRTKKPEGAPTRGKSAYLFFCQANRAEVKEANPSFKATEIMAELGRMWKESSDEDKVEFEEQAAEAKQKYLQEKTEWEERTGLELSPKKPRSKSKAKKSKSDSEPQSEESEPESPKSQSPKPKAKKPKSEPQSEESESEAESPKPKSKKFGSEPVSPAPQKKASKKKSQVASSDEEDN